MKAVMRYSLSWSSQAGGCRSATSQAFLKPRLAFELAHSQSWAIMVCCGVSAAHVPGPLLDMKGIALAVQQPL